jgi:tetratricopeptide (TPR) repeat protein
VTSTPTPARAALDAARASLSAPGTAAPPPQPGRAMATAWDAVEEALRTLLTSSGATVVASATPDAPLTGHELIRELRRRELLSLDQAHALLAFRDAVDRARSGAEPSMRELVAARSALDSLEPNLSGKPPVPAPPASSSPPSPPAASAGGAPAVDARFEPGPQVPAASSRGQGSAIAFVGGMLVVLIVVGIALAVRSSGRGWSFRGREDFLDQGIALYGQGKPEAARAALTSALRADSNRVVARVYLARIAREEGDLAGARAQLASAIRTNPRLAVAQREMGSLLFAQGDFPLAQRFYERAVALDSTDASARGLLGCTLIRRGSLGEGIPLVNGAGPGPWTACLPAPASVR